MHRMQTSRAINIAQASRNPHFSQSLGFAPIPSSDFSATQNELQTFGRICLIISVGFHLGGFGRKRNRSTGKSIIGTQCKYRRSFSYIPPRLGPGGQAGPGSAGGPGGPGGPGGLGGPENP